jgi:HlyD family secretion protein
VASLVAGIEAQQAAKSKGIDLISRELAGLRELYKKNLVRLTRLTQLEREAARLTGERGQVISSAAQAKGKISEIRLQIDQIDHDLNTEVAKELRDIESKIGEFVERKVAAEDQLRRTDIRAPQTGTLFQSTLHTVGGVITAGEPIILIVPDADKLQVEAKNCRGGSQPLAPRPPTSSRGAIEVAQPAVIVDAPPWNPELNCRQGYGSALLVTLAQPSVFK